MPAAKMLLGWAKITASTTTGNTTETPPIGMNLLEKIDLAQFDIGPTADDQGRCRRSPPTPPLHHR
jgi:hypothetical protein